MTYGKYLLFAVATILVTVDFTVCMSRNDIDKCTGAHNTLRALHEDTPPLEWDPSIAAKAQAYAEKLLALNQGNTNTQLIHDSDKTFGENLYWGDNHKPSTCVAASLAWYNEIKDYDWLTAKSLNGKPVGHFTQLVWKNSLKFGVGIAIGKSRTYPEYGNVETFVVAKYSPKGNFYWRGQRYLDFSRNVQHQLPGAIIPSVKDLDPNFDKQTCENFIGDKKCNQFIRSWGYTCNGQSKDYFKKNCYKECAYC